MSRFNIIQNGSLGFRFVLKLIRDSLQIGRKHVFTEIHKKYVSFQHKKFNIVQAAEEA